MKTTLKTIFLSTVATFIAFTVVIYVSCKPDKCHSVICDNGGTCNSSGKCVCATGYEGNSCQTASRNKFIGNWQVSNTTSVTEPAQFPVSIAGATGSVTNVSINNLHNFFLTPVGATVSGINITIPSQLTQGNYISGSGYIYSTSTYGTYNTISMTYQVTDTATKQTVTETEIWGG